MITEQLCQKRRHSPKKFKGVFNQLDATKSTQLSRREQHDTNMIIDQLIDRVRDIYEVNFHSYSRLKARKSQLAVGIAA